MKPPACPVLVTVPGSRIRRVVWRVVRVASTVKIWAQGEGGL